MTEFPYMQEPGADDHIAALTPQDVSLYALAAVFYLRDIDKEEYPSAQPRITYHPDKDVLVYDFNSEVAEKEDKLDNPSFSISIEGEGDQAVFVVDVFVGGECLTAGESLEFKTVGELDKQMRSAVFFQSLAGLRE